MVQWVVRFQSSLSQLVFPKTKKIFQRLSYTDFLFLLSIFCLYLFYFIYTPYNTRSYDVDGHIEYIFYVLEHWSIPPLHGGWEFYQPPLYYFLVALYVKFLSLFTDSRDVLIRSLQFFSLMISSGTAILCFFICRLLSLFPKKVYQYYWIVFIAFFPGFAFFSSRITNDVLVLFFQILSLFFLLLFFQKRNHRYWYTACAVSACAILTKSNGLLLLPVLFLSLTWIKGISLRSKISLGFLGGMMILALCDWIFVVRLLQDPHAGIAGNAGGLNGALGVSQSWSRFLSFDFYRFFLFPYNNPWIDENGRQSFFEYFSKSSISGEWDFGSSLRLHTRLLLAQILGFFPWLFLGFFEPRKQYFFKFFPLWISFIIFFIGQLVFSIRYPFSACQDFRFSVILLLPVAYFIVSSIQSASKPWTWIGQAQLLLFIVSSFVYIIRIAVSVP